MTFSPFSYFTMKTGFASSQRKAGRWHMSLEFLQPCSSNRKIRIYGLKERVLYFSAKAIGCSNVRTSGMIYWFMATKVKPF